MRSLFLNGENPEINFKTTEEAYEKYIPNIENFINELEEYLKKNTQKNILIIYLQLKQY